MSRLYIGGTPISSVYMGGKRYDVKIGFNRKPSSLVYELGETTFDGVTYIDTGIDLSTYEQYTVCLDAQFGDTSSTQNLVDWMTESSPYPVWAIDLNGTRIRFGAKNPLTIENTPAVERRRYVVRYDGNLYTLFSILDATGVDVTSNVATGAVNHTLIFGAYYNNGSISRYMHAGSRIWNAEVYSEALTDEQCINYYENGVVS